MIPSFLFSFTAVLAMCNRYRNGIGVVCQQQSCGARESYVAPQIVVETGIIVDFTTDRKDQPEPKCMSESILTICKVGAVSD